MTTEMMPTVIGTPIEFGAGLKVMPANLSGTDAVPLIDGQTAGILQAINSFTIKQRVRWGEALTQGCIEQSNVYDIYDATNGNHVFVAVERSENCSRCCCAPARPATTGPRRPSCTRRTRTLTTPCSR